MMKPNDVRRSVRVARHDRSIGDAPSIGRVARMARKKGAQSAEPLKRTRSGGKNRKGSRQARGRNRVTLIWTSIIIGLTLLFLGGSVWFLFFPKTTKDTPLIARKSLSIEPEISSSTASPAPNKEQALKIVRDAIASRTAKAVNALFRKGISTDSEILSFLESLESNDGVVENLDWLSNMDRAGMSVEGVLVTFKGKEESVERLAFLTPNEEGVWQMDFDAFARTVKPSWNEFLENGAERAMVRVFVTKDVYYNGPFSDESQWVCYGITSPETDAMMHGYCRVDSKQAEEMERMFSTGARASRATLQLQRVKDGEARQFEIEQIHARDWILTENSESPVVK